MFILFTCVLCVSIQNGLNALHLASKEGHVDVVKELLNQEASIDAATKVSPLFDSHPQNGIT